MRVIGSKIADHFDKHSDDFALIAQVQNSVFGFEFQGRPAILRVTPECHRSYEQIVAEVDWVNYLAEAGVPVAKPIRSIEGALTTSIDLDGAGYTMAAFERAKGEIGHRRHWGPSLFRAWGQVMGSMHVATLKYHPPGIVRAGWRDHLPLGRQDSPDTGAAAELLRALISTIEERKSSNGDFGLIHSDFHYWNFAVDGDSITVFDHDNCEYHWLAADLGTALFEASTCAYQSLERNEFVRQFLSEFLAGYRTQRDPTGLLDHLHDFVKLREIQIFLILSERWQGRTLNPFQTKFFAALRQSVLTETSFYTDTAVTP